MALNDIVPIREASFGQIGTRKYAVALNTGGQGTGSTYVKAFRSGEPVIRALGGYVVTPLYTTAASGTVAPRVGTEYIVGIAASESTETDAVAGYVEVLPLTPGQVWLIAPKVAATFGQTEGSQVQATYDALVGDRVKIDLATSAAGATYCAGSYTLLATDAASGGCVIMPMDVTRYPGKVAFAFREDGTDLHA
jgi:hypothetical protein